MAHLVTLRNGYDGLFAELVAALPLPPETERQSFRLLLLGALNLSQHWFHEGGRSSPQDHALFSQAAARSAENLKLFRGDPS